MKLNLNRSVFSLYKSDLQLCPLNLVVCELLGSDAIGYGEAFSFKLAKMKAYAEALEREAWKSSGMKSTNGFAAGPTPSIAYLHARNEAIERQLLLRAWSEMDGMFTFRPHLSVRALFLIAWLKLHQYSGRFSRINNNVTSFGLYGRLLCPDGGSYFDGVYAERIQDAHVEKLIASLIRMAVVYLHENAIQIENLSRTAKPREHVLLFKNPAVQSAFDWVKQSSQRSFRISEPQTSTFPHAVDHKWSIGTAVIDNAIELRWGQDSLFGRNPYPHPLG